MNFFDFFFYFNNVTVIVTFENFILTVYIVIDELYQKFAPSEVIHRRHLLDAKLSDFETITKYSGIIL